MARRRHHRVVLRPKVRQRRFRQAGAAAAVALLGGIAWLTARQVRRELPSRESLKAWADGRLAYRLEGAPEGYADRMSAAAASAAGGAEAKARRLREEFPFIESVEVRRRWLSKTVTLKAAMRDAVGRSGRGYLAASGEVFEAPPGLYPQALPVLETAGAPRSELEALAQCLLVLRAKPAPSPIASMRFVSPQEGWRIAFADGTTALWGNLRWTGEKVERLREVLADGRDQFPQGLLTADLRYFEDGKILLRRVN